MLPPAEAGARMVCICGRFRARTRLSCIVCVRGSTWCVIEASGGSSLSVGVRTRGVPRLDDLPVQACN